MSRTDRPQGLFLFDAHTGEQRLFASGLYQSPQWSPDGSLLAAWRVHPDRSPQHELLVFEPAAGAEPIAVLPGATVSGRIAWSADGRQIAAAGYGVVYVARIEESLMHRLTEGDSPVWSADGSRLAFTRNGELWQIDLATRKEEKLLAPALPVIGEAQWSPDGRHIAFRTFGDQWGIYAIDPTGENEQYLVPVRSGLQPGIE
jgi:Tol biopolymer transport system component